MGLLLHYFKHLRQGMDIDPKIVQAVDSLGNVDDAGQYPLNVQRNGRWAQKGYYIPNYNSWFIPYIEGSINSHRIVYGQDVLSTEFSGCALARFKDINGDLNAAHICFHNNSIMDCKNMWIEFCRNKCLSIKPIIFCPTIGDLKIITESYVYIDVCWGLISSEGICHNIKVQRIKNGETGDECGYMFDSINDTVPTFPCSFGKEYYIPMH